MEGIHVCSPSNLSNKDNDNRVLHAKVIFCEGERANYSLTGSMNASKAGLFGRGEFGGNAEAAIFRRFAGISVLDERLMTCLDNPFPPIVIIFALVPRQRWVMSRRSRETAGC